MKELNPIYYALIDSSDEYYTPSQARPYLDLKIVYNKYTYDFSTGKPVETITTTKLDLINCSEDDFKITEETMSFYKRTVLRQGLKMLCMPEEAKELALHGTI